MGHKTVELEDLQAWWLDYVIACAVCGYDAHVSWLPGGHGADFKVSTRNGLPRSFSPSKLWSDAGPLIEKFGISLQHIDQGSWKASLETGDSYTHDLPLIATMRALALSMVKGGYQIPTYK